MKLIPNLKLRNVGSQYMIVRNDEGNVNVTNVFSLNATAAWLWNEAYGREFTPTDLRDALCRHFDVVAERAEADVARLIQVWRENRLLIE